MVKLVVENGKAQVDEDGFVALVDSAYEGFVNDNWTLPQILDRFARERRAEHAVIVFPGTDLADSQLQLGAAPLGRIVRSFQATIAITGERVWLCDYTQLTMAAQFDDERATNSSTPWIPIPNGRYLVTVAETSTLLRKKRQVCVNLEPVEADHRSVDAVNMIVPWLEEPRA